MFLSVCLSEHAHGKEHTCACSDRRIHVHVQTDRQTDRNKNTHVLTDRQTDSIAPDKAAYCVFTQFRGAENAIKFISVRTKTQ